MEKKFISLLKQEMKPALGVTEVGAIAFASSISYNLINGELKKITLMLNGGMYKNAFSCAIPGTKELGNEMAAILGAISGDPSLKLQVLKNITEESIKKAKKLKADNIVNVKVLDGKSEIFIQVEIETDKGFAVARIEKFHDNVVYLEKNGEEIYRKNVGLYSEDAKESINFDDITILDLYIFSRNVDISEIGFLKDLIKMNKELSEEGSKGVGLKIDKTLSHYREKGLLSEDMITKAQRLTCSAMDARLSGLSFPAMSVVGSGSHGILCSMPVVSCGETLNSSEEEILRALALSVLITIYSKHYTGRLSSICGCVLGGGTGAATGIVMLMGGNHLQVGMAINHMAANLTGMICDGGSIGCVLKAYTGVESAFISAMLALDDIAISENFGIIGKTPEQTIKNLGRVSMEGMKDMDRTTIDIMQKGK